MDPLMEPMVEEVNSREIPFFTLSVDLKDEDPNPVKAEEYYAISIEK